MLQRGRSDGALDGLMHRVSERAAGVEPAVRVQEWGFGEREIGMFGVLSRPVAGMMSVETSRYATLPVNRIVYAQAFLVVVYREQRCTPR
jgi:hypothetical protein